MLILIQETRANLLNVNYILTKADETYHTELFSVNFQQNKCLQNVQFLLDSCGGGGVFSWKGIKSPAENWPFLITLKNIPLIFFFGRLLYFTFHNYI